MENVDDIRSALDMIESFSNDPSNALEAANAKKQIATRPYRRSAEEIAERLNQVSTEHADALERLTGRLDTVNSGLVANSQFVIESGNDIEIRWNPIRRVGVYVPQRLPATAFTFLSSAKAAGVTELVMYTAQDSSGDLDPLVLWCAHKYGATILGGPARFGFPVLSLGTTDGGIEGCDLVCGPCGRRLNIIKQASCLVAGATSDMSAGPSNLAILADDTADWAQIVVDIVSQLEHGPDSAAEIVLVDDSIEAYQATVVPKLKADDLVRINSKKVSSVELGVSEINAIAPETAEVWVADETAAERITTAGVVYVRQSSSLGDYGAIGRGCADPTERLSRSQSGLSPFTFMRNSALVRNLQPDPSAQKAAELLAAYEGLEAHRTAIRGVHASEI